MGRHLLNCKHHTCPSHFKCPDAYCIPTHTVCNGKADCPHGEDETNCQMLTCPGFLFCRHDNVCVHPYDIWTGHVKCAVSQDDKALSDVTKCPLGCSCLGYSISCKDDSRWVIPQISRGLRSIFLERVVSDLQDLELLDHRPYFLLHLYISNCTLSAIKGNLLAKVPFLKYLNLSYNKLSSLPSVVFHRLNNVEVIDLSQNLLTELHPGIFNGTPIIRLIILNNNHFHSIASCTFGALKHLEVLFLSENRLAVLGNNVLCGRSIKELNISNNPLVAIDRNVLMQSNTHLTLLDTTPVHLCCFVPDTKRCSPSKKFYISSCRNLLRELSHQLLFWFSGTILLVVTLFSIAWLSYQIRSTKCGLNMHILLLALFLCHLYFAIYFLTIAFANYTLSGYYSLYADIWRTHVVCKLCNICSFVSYHSVTFIASLISYIRMLATLCPFKARSLSVALQVLAVILWILGASLVGFLVTLFTDHLSQSRSALGLGLLLPPESTKVPRWTSAFFVAPHAVMLTVFAFCQCMTIFKLRSSDILKSKSSVSKKERGIALSLVTLIVVTLSNIPLLSMHVLGMADSHQTGILNSSFSVTTVTSALIPLSNFVLYIMASRNVSKLLPFKYCAARRNPLSTRC